ncbi:MAG: MscL family protein [Candidatus Bathyarchaeota archaeon]|nr:MscL family protein [Candidatus Bathyarchaeota archaeon]
MSNYETQREILGELKKIRMAVEPKPEPPTPKPEGFRTEFRVFLEKRNVVGLALAVIIGGAAGNLVSALVEDILMPIVSVFIPSGGWRVAFIAIGDDKLLYGHFAGAILDFLIIALIIFVIMRQLEKVGIS